MTRPLSSGIPPSSVVGKIIATIKSRARSWVPLLFLSLSLLYFLPMLSGKNIFVERDLAGFFLPPKYLWVSMVKSFRLPLWNPHNYSGIPLLATLQPGVFYPPHVLYLLLPFNVAWNWLIILHVCFAGISTYLLLLRLRASTVGAFVGGIVFMLSGYVISIHNLLTHLFAVPWFPLAMIGLLRYFETGGRKYLVFCAAILAVQFFAGAPEITIVTVMALCALTCFIDAFACEVVPHADSLPARFKALGLTLVLFCLLVSVQALPFLELKAHSIRAAGLSYQEAVTWSFAWRDFIQFFVPDAFGYFSTVKKYWSNQSWLLTLYWGIAPFFLSSLYFISQDRRRVPFLALMFLSLLFALGGNTPAYRLLHLVPPFNSIRYPVKFIFLFLFLVALTAGLGIDVLKKGVFEKNPTIKRSISIAFYGGFVFVLLWGYISIFGSTVYTYFDAMGFKPDAYNNIAVNIHNIKRFLLFSFLFCILLLVYLRVRFKKTALFLIVLIVSLDLFLANNGYYTAGSWKFYIGREEGGEHSFLHYMAANGKTERYFVSYKTMNEFNHFPYDRAITGPPYAALFGLYSLGGMEVMRITHHEVFSRLVKDSQSLEEGKRYLAIAGIRYMVTSYPLEDRDFALVKSIETGGKTAYLYEYRSWPGRFLLFGRIRRVEDDRAMIEAISDKGIDLQKELLLLSEKAIPYEERAVTGKVDLLSYEANTVRLTCTADNDAFLYVSDTYYPGWRAAVDGTPTTLYRANLAFRAVLVPKGSHIVTFTYVPLSFYVGLIVTAIGLLASMCVVARDRKGRGRGV